MLLFLYHCHLDPSRMDCPFQKFEQLWVQKWSFISPLPEQILPRWIFEHHYIIWQGWRQKHLCLTLCVSVWMFGVNPSPESCDVVKCWFLEASLFKLLCGTIDHCGLKVTCGFRPLRKISLVLQCLITEKRPQIKSVLRYLVTSFPASIQSLYCSRKINVCFGGHKCDRVTFLLS